MPMKFTISFIFSVFLLFANTISAQQFCGFDKVHQSKIASDPAYKKIIEDNEFKIQQYIKDHPNETLKKSGTSAALFTIPVVVHVIHTGGAVGTIYNPSDAQITATIDYLNQVFNGTYPGTQGVGDLEIQFVLAKRDPNCNTTNGIDRYNASANAAYVSNGVNNAGSSGISDLALKDLSRWDATQYYNIWVVNKIDGADGTSGQFVAGYAYFAGASANLDGTVMLATQMTAGQKTLPHEIGHALNLYHTFAGSANSSVCPTDADCTADGDRVCDTDPVSNNVTSGIYDFSCRTGTNSCTGANYSSNTEHNYMAYTNCYDRFTAGQKARLLAAMSLPSRASLANSWAASNTYPVTPFVAPLAASCTPNSSPSGTSSYIAGISNLTISDKTFSSGFTRDDNGYVNRSGNCLYITSLQRNATYNFSLTVLGANIGQLRMWIDYDNNGIFDNVTEQIYYNNNVVITQPASNSTVTGSFTVPATAVLNTTLRLRVIDEVSTAYGGGFLITGACYAPTYGQAEDYPIYVTSTLPVKLDYFMAVRKKEAADISWRTSFEQNASGFEIEKSANGQNFTTIGTVVASNSASGKVYNFTDVNLGAKQAFYRLKQIDFDKKTEYSSVVKIGALSEKVRPYKVLSNPFSNTIEIRFTTINSHSATIQLFDLNGKTIYMKNQSISTGQNESAKIPGTELPAGIYMLRIVVGTEVFTEKLIKQ